MKWRIMAALMSFTLIVLVVQDIPLYNFMRTSQREQVETSLQRDAFVVAGRAQSALWTSSPQATSFLENTARAYRDAGGARVVVVDKKGVAIVTSDDDQSALGSDYSTRPEVTSALSGTIVAGERFSTSLQENLLYVAVPVLNGADVIGAVRLTYPAKVVSDAVDAQLRMLGIIAVSTLLLAGIIGYIIASSLSRQLRLLESATQKLADGNLSMRADERSGPGEIRSLATSFNQMAERLNVLIEQQRRFAGDASHQLRTPLTALRLRLERANDLISADPVAAGERLRAAEGEVDRLASIVEGLLLLSRTESASTTSESVDLAEIARERVDHWQALAKEQNVSVRFEGPVHAFGLAVRTAPEQVIDNYVDNALGVSPPGSRIIIRVADGVDVKVSVLDEGPGLSSEDCARAFDRFWRATSDDRGSGLGLAIVSRLMFACGGSAYLEPRSPRGLAAIALFPGSN
jgi:signal transduction histidine kinase